MCKKIIFLLILSLLIISCSEDNSSGPSNENGSGSQGSEIPCNTTNEGMVIKPADSETERICKDGVWEVVLNSSSSVQVVDFATAGSQVLDYEGKARHLFHCMCEAMRSAELSSYHLVLGVGSKLIKGCLKTNKKPRIFNPRFSAK